MRLLCVRVVCFFFFFNDTATTEIYTLSLHDALPISTAPRMRRTAGCRGTATPGAGAIRRAVAGVAPNGARRRNPTGGAGDTLRIRRWLHTQIAPPTPEFEGVLQVRFADQDVVCGLDQLRGEDADECCAGSRLARLAGVTQDPYRPRRRLRHVAHDRPRRVRRPRDRGGALTRPQARRHFLASTARWSCALVMRDRPSTPYFLASL